MLVVSTGMLWNMRWGTRHQDAATRGCFPSGAQTGRPGGAPCNRTAARLLHLPHEERESLNVGELL